MVSKKLNSTVDFVVNSLYIPNKEITVIIPVKNEFGNISGIIKSINNQHFPLKLIRIIFVDDCSTDDSYNKIEIEKHENPGLNIKILKSDSTGKKAAIAFGVKNAVTDFIVTTDCDVIHSPLWLLNIAAYCETFNPKMLIGKVFMNSFDFFGEYQALDFEGMQLIGEGMALSKKPVLCNGANLTFSRKCFLEVEGYLNNKEVNSGDDIFLMHSFLDKYGKDSIHYLNSKDSFVETNSQNDLNSFINQRIRWASKTKYYLSKNTALLGVLIFSINLGLLLSLILAISSRNSLLSFIFFLGLKSTFDYYLFKVGNKKWLKTKQLKYLIVFELINVFFVPFLALLSIAPKNTNWKS